MANRLNVKRIFRKDGYHQMHKNSHIWKYSMVNVVLTWYYAATPILFNVLGSQSVQWSVRIRGGETIQKLQFHKTDVFILIVQAILKDGFVKLSLKVRHREVSAVPIKHNWPLLHAMAWCYIGNHWIHHNNAIFRILSVVFMCTFRSSYHTFHLKLFGQWRLYWFTVWIQQRGQNPCYVGNGYGGAIELQCKQQCVVHESILVLKRNGRTGHVILMDTNKICYTGALSLSINHRSEIEFWKQ